MQPLRQIGANSKEGQHNSEGTGKSYEKWLKELSIFSLQKKELRIDMITVFGYIMVCRIKKGVGVFSVILEERTASKRLKFQRSQSRLDIRTKLWYKWSSLYFKMIECCIILYYCLLYNYCSIVYHKNYFAVYLKFNSNKVPHNFLLKAFVQSLRTKKRSWIFLYHPSGCDL